jgi:hypothetical protein
VGHKKSGKQKPISVYPGDVVMKALGLDPSEWSVAVWYSKGILTGNRYSSVTVRHKPSGRALRQGFYPAGKAAARRDAITVARQLVRELRGG